MLMGLLNSTVSEISFVRYNELLKRTGEHLHSLKPSSIIALARKGPRLLQIMNELGIHLPEVPIIADPALDFVSSDELGSRPVIFDDVTVVGTSLFRLQQRLQTEFNLHSTVVAVLADTANFHPQLVDDYWCAGQASPAETQQFSSELIRTIPLLGLPYDLDHPIFTFDRPQGEEVFAHLLQTAETAHREHLSLQYDNDVSVTTIHLHPQVLATCGSVRAILGDPDLLKIKVINSRFCERLQFAVVSCFPVSRKAWLQRLWKDLRLPETITRPIAMYRVLCCAGARLFGNTIASLLNDAALTGALFEWSTAPCCVPSFHILA
jgi:hypothetical protein